ncbi:flavin reductase family protein [Deinococcus sp. HMF7604]|uniref:flavin reductase family protein n=1 Tax=Deinococcus betulae TaxID=2873312 RepID=UPI001CC98EA3|nr:flavin reductase family protein [Deinococcus betulae]MBZ9751915.1 flavin reductase family protein [Deinococcus betulae]
MLRERTDRFFGYYPGTVALVTAVHDGVRNVMAAGWHTALSAEPPLYGVAVGRARATHPLIEASGRFGVNFLPYSRAGAVQGSGVYSLHGGHDKHALLSLPTLPGEPLALASAYLHYTCTLSAVLPTGDHDLMVGQVQAVHYDPDAYDDQGLLVAQPAIYLGRSLYTTTTKARTQHGG